MGATQGMTVIDFTKSSALRPWKPLSAVIQHASCFTFWEQSYPRRTNRSKPGKPRTLGAPDLKQMSIPWTPERAIAETRLLKRPSLATSDGGSEIRPSRKLEVKDRGNMIGLGDRAISAIIALLIALL